MGLKIRMRKQGRTNSPSYRVVVTDVRTKRDGKYVEALGWYNPLARQEDQQISLNAERISFWIEQGAEPSERVCSILEKVAPSIMRQQTQKCMEQRAKAAVKRKERKKATAA